MEKDENLPVVVPEETPHERAIKFLSEEERLALEEFKNSGKPGLAPSICASFFELYLNGNSVQEIKKLNKPYDLGSIIAAKVQYLWDEQKDNYITELQSRAMARLLQTQAESVGFLADALAVSHKKYGSSLKKYLQTGDESELLGFDLGSIAAYSKSLEALLKITGQDKKKVQFEGTLNSNVNISNSDKPVTSDQAAKILQILADDEE